MFTNGQGWELKKKKKSEFYKVLKYLFIRMEMSTREEDIIFINKCSLLFYSQQELR